MSLHFTIQGTIAAESESESDETETEVLAALAPFEDGIVDRMQMNTALTKYV